MPSPWLLVNKLWLFEHFDEAKWHPLDDVYEMTKGKLTKAMSTNFSGIVTRAVDRILKSRIKSDLKSRIKSDLSDFLTGRKPLLLRSF